MKNITTLLLTVLLVAVSCTENASKTIIEDIEAQIIEFTPFEPLANHYSALGLDKVGDGLLILNVEYDYHYSYYDFKTGKVIDFMREGRGPNEYLAPAFHGQTEGRDNNYIWILDVFKQQLDLIDMTAVKEGNQNFSSKTIKVKNQFQHLCVINDTTLIGALLMYDNCSNVSYNPTNNKLKYIESALDYEIPFHFAQGMAAYDTITNRIYTAYRSRHQLDIISTDGELVHSYYINKIPTLQDIEDNKAGFNNIVFDDNYIYASGFELKDGEEKGFIWIFDKDFNLKAKWNIPTRSSFAIYDDKIYLARFGEEEAVWVGDKPEIEQ